MRIYGGEVVCKIGRDCPSIYVVTTELLPPERAEEIRARLEELDFFTTVYGAPRAAGATERMRRQASWFGAHQEDRVL